MPAACMPAACMYVCVLHAVSAGCLLCIGSGFQDACICSVLFRTTYDRLLYSSTTGTCQAGQESGHKLGPLTHIHQTDISHDMSAARYMYRPCGVRYHVMSGYYSARVPECTALLQHAASLTSCMCAGSTSSTSAALTNQSGVTLEAMRS